MNKIAKTDFEILEIFKNRWSPRAFSEKQVEKEKLQRIFEAARWSPSGGNLQPWVFITGRKNIDPAFETIFNALAEGNKKWAGLSSVLVVVCSEKINSKNGKPNAWSEYDAGQSAAYLSVQALSEGIYVHQMGGINKEKLIRDLNIPENYQPVTVIAMGYLGNPDDLPEDLKQREIAERTRNPAHEFIFSGKWGTKSNIF